MGTFAPRCRARRGGLLNRLTTDRWGACFAVGGAAPWSLLSRGPGRVPCRILPHWAVRETQSVSPQPSPQSEIYYLSDCWAGRRTLARMCLQPRSTVYTRRRRSGWAAEAPVGAWDAALCVSCSSQGSR
eukprot:2961160-Rhodomonas_salina.1